MSVSGLLSANGGISIPDDDYLSIGTGNDLQIREDGEDVVFMHTDGDDVRFNSVSGQTTAWIFQYQNETIAQFRANSYCNLYFNNAEQLRTLSDGVYFPQNVGIGTASPSSELDVRNGDITVYTTTANTGNWLYFRNDDVTTSTESTGLAWTFNSASTRYVEILVDYDVRATQGLLIHSGYPITCLLYTSDAADE